MLKRRLQEIAQKAKTRCQRECARYQQATVIVMPARRAGKKTRSQARFEPKLSTDSAIANPRIGSNAPASNQATKIAGCRNLVKVETIGLPESATCDGEYGLLFMACWERNAFQTAYQL